MLDSLPFAELHKIILVNDIYEVDHIVALINGGNNEFDNLQLLHRHCHDTKTTADMALTKVNKK